jgi:hypothetical protein
MEIEMEHELKHDDPQFLPVQYGLTEERLNQLATDYDPALIPEATEVGDEGYKEIHSKAMAIIKVRTNIEKVRKNLKEDSLKWGRKVDGEAKRLTAIVEKIEAPWKQVKLDLEEAERQRAEAELAAEQERVGKIEERIAGIRNLAEGLIGADSDKIQRRINRLRNAVVTENDFGEFAEAAKVTGDIVMKSLKQALEERVAFEVEQAAVRAEQEELDRQKADLKREQKELFDEKMAIKASEDAAKAAEEAEAQRKAEVKEAAQRAADKAQADKENKAYLKARLPQDHEVRAYSDRLFFVTQSCPTVEDENLAALVAVATTAVLAAVKTINDEVQEVK